MKNIYLFWGLCSWLVTLGTALHGQSPILVPVFAAVGGLLIGNWDARRQSPAKRDDGGG